MKISGKFEVNLNPLDSFAEGVEGNTLGRMSIEKTFHGELSATSKGEMLSAMSPVKGAAGYVAIEQVIGELAGKQGSFVLQHFGTMNGGEDKLILEVVPCSGTDQLTGLIGSMEIRIEAGEHFYDFEYSIG
ncbi:MULTISPECIES: DUF3224 domain-containing protein [Gammaproteobacteria]|uniref:DUF3224 domain-containing protein n=1 Tax=Gammaproteobacteria TaxID=1236 RepID=UPI000DCFE953|nr:MULTISPECIES: DUF3224 domain-containing protein [Gammaproteobacteria]RTE87068.1 DUF3224 domain-containing protein [Aliidiomarina sp. B3213]TCZ93142.1 DUF3224 domain-containing protein [Lysobacter sp. N42]